MYPLSQHSSHSIMYFYRLDQQTALQYMSKQHSLLNYSQLYNYQLIHPDSNNGYSMILHNSGNWQQALSWLYKLNEDMRFFTSAAKNAGALFYKQQKRRQNLRVPTVLLHVAVDGVNGLLAVVATKKNEILLEFQLTSTFDFRFKPLHVFIAVSKVRF